jgi:hypothetical protein
MCAARSGPCMSFTTESSPAMATRLAIAATTTSARITSWPSSCCWARWRMWCCDERIIMIAASST